MSPRDFVIQFFRGFQSLGKSIWIWIVANSQAIQAIAMVLALGALWFAFRSLQTELGLFRLEVEKFNLDYGSQIELSYSGALLIAKVKNEYVSSLRVETRTFLRLSETQYTPQNPIYIELKNFYDCGAEDVLSLNKTCEYSNQIQGPIKKSLSIDDQLVNLIMLFNTTPTKYYPSLFCVSKVSYTDPRRDFHEEYYISPGCNITTYFPSHSKVTKEKYFQELENMKILATVDYNKIGKLGLADFQFTHKLTNLLSKEKWHRHYIENAAHRWYRTVYTFADGDLESWHKILRSEKKADATWWEQ